MWWLLGHEVMEANKIRAKAQEEFMTSAETMMSANPATLGLREKLVATAMLTVLSVGALACGSGEGDDSDAARTSIADLDRVAACEDADFASAGYNNDDWARAGFVPRAEEETVDTNTASNRIHRLFMINEEGPDGPLGAEIDKVSLAAFVAAITKPATDGGRINPTYNYGEAFANTYFDYRADGGEELARQDCATTLDTMILTAEYDDDWAMGETVTRLAAVRNDENRLTGMRVTEVVVSDDEPLTGVAFKLNRNRELDDGTVIDGFVEVLLGDDGVLYVKGIPIEAGTFTLDDAQAPSDQQDTEDVEGTENPGVSNGGGGGSGNGAGEGPGHNGDTRGCDGTCGTGSSGGGTGGGCGGGCGTGGGGGGTGGGGGGGTTPPVTQPPVTQPPVTQPPVTQPPVTTTQPPYSPPSTHGPGGGPDPNANQ